MDYQIASKNVIFTIVLLSLLYIIGTYFYRNVSDNQTVSLCSNGQQITAVFDLRESVTILLPSSSVKDTLDCLRRGMSFNDRTIEYVVASDASNDLIKALEDRYMVNEVQSELDLSFINAMHLSRDMFETGVETSSSAIFLKEITNPFELIDYIAEKNPKVLIMPELNEVIAHLIENNEHILNTIITELHEGEYISFNL